MEQLDELDRNRHGSKNNINKFAQIFESEDGKGTTKRTKTKTKIIVISEYEERRKNKGYQNKGNEEYGYDWEKKITTKT